MRARSTIVCGFLLVLLAGVAGAHEVRPGYLQLREVDAGRFDVLWKVPMRGDARLRLAPVFPAGCQPVTPVSTQIVPGSMVERWTEMCAQGLVGGTITIEGLMATMTDVVVRIELADGSVRTALLKPASPEFTVPETPGTVAIAGSYLRLGIEHILGGIDHLLFVLGLLLIVRGRWLLAKTITAFTAAHSITLALAVLGVVAVPVAPVEAVIALSILFLASELAKTQIGRSSLTVRYPWVVAFTFGLLHGFGFAGALTEIGLPQSAIPLALFLFNVGVEMGQLAFVAAVLTLGVLVRRAAVPWPQWSLRVPAYAIGSAAAFWTIQRVASFLPL